MRMLNSIPKSLSLTEMRDAINRLEELMMLMLPTHIHAYEME